MNSTYRRLAAGLTAAAILFAACGGGATTAPTTAPETPAPATTAPETTTPETPAPAALEAVMIPKQINNPYFDVAYKGAQNAAAELGGSVTQVGPSAADATQQIPFIQDATTQGAGAIIVSANDATAIAPALQEAMTAGVKVVGYDSSPAPGAYDVFVNQADTAGIGRGLAEMACNLAPDCTGEIAVLSAAQSATNQNAWIAAMEETLAEADFAGLDYKGVVYGNDDPQVSTTQAQGLLQTYPNLKVIIAPTTVGIVAAAQVVRQADKTGEVFVTGLGTPAGMVDYVKGGESPEFALWNVTDLGYLAYVVAAKLAAGEITGAEGETFTVAGLNDDQPYTIGADSVVVLGPPFVFNAENIDRYVEEFGF